MEVDETVVGEGGGVGVDRVWRCREGGGHVNASVRETPPPPPIILATDECLVCLSLQAIDGDCNQTGQMTAALLDWPQVGVSVCGTVCV